MFKPQLHHHHSNSTQSLLTRRHKVFAVAGDGSTCGGGVDKGSSTPFLSLNKLPLPIKRCRSFHAASRSPPPVPAMAADQTSSSTKVKAVIVVQVTMGGVISSLDFTKGLDDITDLLGKSLLLELVAAEVDHKTGLMKDTIRHYAHRLSSDLKDVKYVAEFEVPKEFGEIGAVLIENEHHKEMYLETIKLDGFSNGPITINPSSWVHSKFDNAEKRIFFTNKSYLPSETPSGLKVFRGKDLASLRGDGILDGPRKKHDRIYDYDVYNDLGDPDKKPELARPVIGTKDFPYPRRCKTGRRRTKSDPLSESRSSSFYVPRDEAFSELKNLTFSAKTVYSVMHAVVPSLQTSIIDKELGFPHFTSIDSLFNEGVHLPPLQSKGFLGDALPRLLKLVGDTQNNILRFETPERIHRDKFFWIKDEEFCRQTLAGLNPCGIHLVKEWPLKSKLDPEVYGPPESAITKEIVEHVIGGFIPLEQALERKKLFIIDYHDILLPYVNKVREIKDMKTTLYGSRLLMFLTPTGTLRPVAIELVRPPGNGKPQWKQAFTPSWDSTAAWLWKLAKVHFLAHDTGIHQLVSHWLRTHCCTEPYIIACNRQLSAMHPIYRLLHPHFRYTMEINALARESLINCGGIIESCFSPGKYSIELSSIAYGQLWRFDQEGLPADLISRGMAEEDPNSPHGLKLAIEDYPYANDGLVLWDAIKGWVTDYVDHYYPNADLVASDEELQAWWTEIRTLGHQDKKDEPWWPLLTTPQDLIGTLATMIWVTSGHHAAVNFGQYDYGGYVPGRSTIARIKMPCEDPTEERWESFRHRPEDELLATFPSQLQASQVMSVLDVLSNHSPDEEYIGEKMEPSFELNPKIKAAYERFAGKLKELEGIIDDRNANTNLKNRNGVGIPPYQLLKPFSKPGVTGMGVPNSISI
ncbi:linoleate 13S-lipoxygenase 2-1, chloroplastic-like [Cynara cardunculus var. scolymus]|uniref:linoleate 13S-lipoxygenase 2-1, chloroplastic-like n=1 Tax=Cynara cardunculus var. scolymus TaxID=59895 RepID=UPI000D62C6A8|nr:linoleate 13S-lipoxygenase 2-1, chloroplastic-like [Cynara cardunculus var. scolymus]